MTEHHANAGLQSLALVWVRLRDLLAERFRQLSSEIRHYPTPIARCDDQLSKLIEQRDLVRAEIEHMNAADATVTGSDAPAQSEIDRFLEATTPSDDDAEHDLRSRLKAALFPALHISEWK